MSTGVRPLLKDFVLYIIQMSDKTVYLRAFNTHIFEFIDDIIGIFPDNMSIATTKTTFEMTKKANPTLLVKLWYKFVYSPYAEIIDAGDLDFFINKDYTAEVSALQNAKDVINAIDGLRNPIRVMSETNKAHSLEYIRNLCQLSVMYNGRETKVSTPSALAPA